MPNLLSSQVAFQEAPPTAIAIPSAATAVLGMVGVAQRGPFTQQLCQVFEDWLRTFGGATANNSDSYLSVKAFFDNGGTELHFVRVVHFSDATDPTTKTSASASMQLQTAAVAPTAGKETGTNTAPWALVPAQTLNIKTDGGSTQPFTFNATVGSALAANAQPYALTNGWTLLIAIDGGPVQTVPFLTSMFASIGAATAAEVAAVLNAYFSGHAIGAVATVVGGAVKVTSNTLGTGSTVVVSGGTAAAAFGFASTAGTGNVANIAMVTGAEFLAVTAGLTGGTTSVVGGHPVITSGTTGGASSVQVVAGSTTAAEFGFDNAIHTGSAGTATNTLQVLGKTDGAYANSLSIKISAATNGQADHFNLTLLNGPPVETWVNLSMTVGAADYALSIVNDVNNGSQYITLVDDLAAVASPGNLPAAGTFGPLTGGLDGLAGLVDADFVGGQSVGGSVGLRALDEVQNLTLLAVPGRATASVHNNMLTYCEITRAGSVFAILDPPKNQSASQMVTYVTQTAALKQLSEFGAIYWPNVLVDNPSTAVYGNANTLVAPPSGAIAGLYSRIDSATPAGVFVHPAGIDNGRLFNVRGLEMPEVKKREKRDLVFPQLINPISTEPGLPIFVDGARTLRDNANFPTIGERRGVIFIETSGRIGLAFMRHKNIAPRLYNDGKRASVQFLEGLTRNHAFASDDPAKAFSVDFGPGLNPPSVQHARTVLAKWSVATAKPAEFIVVTVSPDTRALDAELAALAAA